MINFKMDKQCQRDNDSSCDACTSEANDNCTHVCGVYSAVNNGAILYLSQGFNHSLKHSSIQKDISFKEWNSVRRLFTFFAYDRSTICIITIFNGGNKLIDKSFNL